jgi:hypothetical protein
MKVPKRNVGIRIQFASERRKFKLWREGVMSRLILYIKDTALDNALGILPFVLIQELNVNKHLTETNRIIIIKEYGHT